MIAELLLLQQLLDNTNMVTPPESSVTTATPTYQRKEPKARKAEELSKGYIERGRKGYGL
jgi:hypothetical protein